MAEITGCIPNEELEKYGTDIESAAWEAEYAARKIREISTKMTGLSLPEAELYLEKLWDERDCFLRELRKRVEDIDYITHHLP